MEYRYIYNITYYNRFLQDQLMFWTQGVENLHNYNCNPTVYLASISIEFDYIHDKIKSACSVYTANGWSLQWHNNERDGVSNRRRLYCLFNRLFWRRSKKMSKLSVTGLCEGNSLVTGEFPAQRASNAENVSIWWRHHIKGRALYGKKLDGM